MKFFIPVLTVSVMLIAVPAHAKTGVAGTYRCWSFNFGGKGGSCELSPPLVLHKNGTYDISSEHGTYKVKSGRIILSRSKVRGPGILQNGNQIVFQYTYKGIQQTITYLCQDCSAPHAAGTEGARVSAGVTVRFPKEYGSSYVSGVNTVSLLPTGADEANYIKTGQANEVYDSIAVKKGAFAVNGWFRGVPSGRRYIVFVSTGFERRPVGTLDLRHAVGQVKASVTAPPLQANAGETPPPDNPPPTDGYGTPPPQSGGDNPPPQDGYGTPPPQTNGTETPPQDSSASPQNGYNAPSQGSGGWAPPQSDNSWVPPQSDNNWQRPQTGQ